jgi:prophage antirepressor-like protein
MNELQIFQNPQFGEIRTITEDGVTLFCGNDVAIALGYSDPKKAIARHCKGGTKRPLPTKGGTQDAVFIPEGDIYRLAARSELPGADAFERWIFDEVLPSIRKHGTYAIDTLLDNPDLAIKAFTALKKEREKSKALEKENERQRQEIADFQPMRQYLDTILSSTGVLATTQIAADYGLSAKQLNRILHEEGIQRNVNGQWILYRKHMGKGYTKSATLCIQHTHREPETKLHTYWTQKGRVMIHTILTQRGILALMDRTA